MEQNAPMNDQPIAPASPMKLAALFFSPTGRISRQAYWLALAVLTCINFSLRPLWEGMMVIQTGADGVDHVVMTGTGPIAMFILLLFQWVFFVLIAKRARDFGWPGLIALLWVVPLINFLVLFGVGLKAGDPGPNRFGWAPNQ